MPRVDQAPPALCVSLHDVSPATWPACARLLSMIDALGSGSVPVTLLVVPDYHRRGRIDHDPAFLRTIERRLAKGDEVALHGYYHLDDQTRPRGATDWLRRCVYTAGEGEFDALDAEEAGARLEQGLALMRRLAWPVHGFVAPAWLLGAGTRTALCRLPFAYTTTLRAIHRLPDWRMTPSPGLVYSVRGPLRRAVSRGWNTWLFAQLRQREAPLRLELHPADARHEAVVGHWWSLIERALPHRHPMTKHRWLEATA